MGLRVHGDSTSNDGVGAKIGLQRLSAKIGGNSLKSGVSAKLPPPKGATSGRLLAVSPERTEMGGLGGGASLQRTRLRNEFPDKQGINREFSQIVPTHPNLFSRKPLQSLHFSTEFPMQRNRELTTPIRESKLDSRDCHGRNRGPVRGRPMSAFG